MFDHDLSISGARHASISPQYGRTNSGRRQESKSASARKGIMLMSMRLARGPESGNSGNCHSSLPLWFSLPVMGVT